MADSTPEAERIATHDAVDVVSVLRDGPERAGRGFALSDLGL